MKLFIFLCISTDIVSFFEKQAQRKRKTHTSAADWIFLIGLACGYIIQMLI